MGGRVLRPLADPEGRKRRSFDTRPQECIENPFVLGGDFVCNRCMYGNSRSPARRCEEALAAAFDPEEVSAVGRHRSGWPLRPSPVDGRGDGREGPPAPRQPRRSGERALRSSTRRNYLAPASFAERPWYAAAEGMGTAGRRREEAAAAASGVEEVSPVGRRRCNRPMRPRSVEGRGAGREGPLTPRRPRGLAGQVLRDSGVRNYPEPSHLRRGLGLPLLHV